MSRMGSGPTSARVMLVGEAFGEQEERAGEPFVGASGQELNRMLHEAGILRSECYVTNVVNARPAGNDFGAWMAYKKKDITPSHREFNGKWVLPIVLEGIERLRREIALVDPDVIVALGNVPLWALTPAWGILKWRGSQLKSSTGHKLIPTIHPAAILRQWDMRAAVVTDLKRVARELGSKDYSNVPNWQFLLRPSAEQVAGKLAYLYAQCEAHPEGFWIDFDLETRAGHIACAGLSWSSTEALCIPLMCVERKEGYFLPDEEAGIVHLLYQLLTHPNARVRGQNLLYDCQYTYRHWHFVPHVAQDTLVSFHSLYSGLPKRLDFQASLLCDHYVYWKDDGKTWEKNVGEDQLWAYNCIDCVRTREVGEVELTSIQQLGLSEVDEFQQRLFWPILRAMQLGIRVDKKERDRLALVLQEEMAEREHRLKAICGHPISPRSHVQLSKFFYQDLNLPPIMSKAKKGAPAHITCDDDALKTIAKREPLTRPIIRIIQEYRSLGVFLSTFVLAGLDTDGRLRCSFNMGGAETYRLSSSKNAFGSGTNFQNIPAGGKDEEDSLELPNIRTLFIPDPGFTFFDCDLDRADLQVVVWESDEADLKAALRMGVDMHLLNAYTLSGKEPPPYEELVEGHPRYQDHRIPYKRERQLAKSFIHGTNYGGGARTMAQAAGVTVHQADRFQHIYFSRYPGLKAWHERTQKQLHHHRFVENRFGYRRYYFDRVDGLLPEALAWIPQSTVACYINRLWLRLYNHHPEIQVLLQVHDSLAGQFPTHLRDACIAAIRKEAAQIAIPYDDPLVIPVGVNYSEKSWGSCK